MSALEQKAEELGGRLLSRGINWRWVTFPSREAATEFVNWLNEHGFEHRGVYNPPESDPEQGWDVRYR